MKTKLQYKVGCLIEAAQKNEIDVLAQQLNCFCTRKSGIAPLIDKAFPRMGEADDATKRGCKDKLGKFCIAHYSTDPTLEFGEGSSTRKFKGSDDVDLILFGLYGQFGWWNRRQGRRDTDYEALADSLVLMERRLGYYRDKSAAHIGIPLLGSGLAGGDWKIVSDLVQRILCDEGWNVTVYVLNEKDIPEENL